jgi:hypothetical protein
MPNNRIHTDAPTRAGDAPRWPDAGRSNYGLNGDETWVNGKNFDAKVVGCQIRHR